MGVETAVCTGVTETAGAAGAVEAVETAAFGSNSAKPSPGVPMTQTFVRLLREQGPVPLLPLHHHWEKMQNNLRLHSR